MDLHLVENGTIAQTGSESFRHIFFLVRFSVVLGCFVVVVAAAAAVVVVVCLFPAGLCQQPTVRFRYIVLKPFGHGLMPSN